MEIAHYNLKEGDKVWACAYRMDGDSGHMKLKCEPEYGIIVKLNKYTRPIGYSKLKKDGTPYNSKVDAYSRNYTTTKEECIKLYNELIDNNIKRLQSKIEIMEGDKINV